MRLGYSITSAIPDGVPAYEAATGVIERVSTAADVGYDLVETGDHHVVGGGGYLQSIPTASRLAAHVDRVAIMCLLPLYHPILVAEQVGTVSTFVDELDLWVAVGRAGPQYDAFGISPPERGRRLVEALALIRRLWDHDDVDFDGEFWQLDGVSVSPKASPRICLGGSAEVAVRRAGRRGDAWVANADTSPAFIDEARGWFEAEGGGDLIVRRDVLALDDGERAETVAREALERGYRGWSPEADWVLSGDADAIAAQLARLEELGADEVVVRPMLEEHAIETLETVAAARDLRR